jgi:N-methylhydantoinase A
MRTSCEVDVRYHGQGLRLSVGVTIEELRARGLAALAEKFDAEHKRLFTFALPHQHEVVTLRAAVRGRGISIRRPAAAKGSADAKAAVVGMQSTYIGGKTLQAEVYQRSRLRAGNLIAGPAIVMEMDSTTLILPAHQGVVDDLGNILIYPEGHSRLRH